MEYRLGDIIDCIKGYAFKSKEFRVSGIPIVKVSNLNEGLIDNNKWVYLDINMYDRFKKYKLKEDDAVISTVGSWKNNPNSVVGKCCIIHKKNEGNLLNQNAVIVRSNTKYLSQKYLGYILNSLNFQNYIEGCAQGSASQASITLRDIQNYIVDIPNIDIQNKITRIIESIDKKIELNGLINNNLQKINDQLYKSWFVDFEFPDENGQPYKSSKGKMVNSEFGDIPENWKIGHVDDKILTRIIKSGVSKFLGTKKYIATGNVAENIITGFELVEYKNKPSRANMTPISNSVWLAKMQNSVKNILVDEYMYEILNECIFSTGFMGIECLEDSLYYFWSLINSEDFIDKKNNLSTGTLMAGINNTTIVNYKYLIPDKKVLKKFNIKARSINQIIYNNIVESNKLTQIRNTLLPKLMNGKINLDKIEN